MKVISSTFQPETVFSLDRWRTPGRRMWTKVLAILVSISFLLPFMSFAFQAGSYPGGLIGEFGYTPLKANGNTIHIKPDWGRVTGSFQGNSGRTIVYIQDLHCNYEVQTNIRLMLERMMKKNKLRLVGVEGESTPVSVSKLSTVPAEDLRKNISEYFMQRGRITGPEYQSAVTDGGLILQGIESERLYVDNRDTLMKFLNEESQGYCEDLRYALERLKRPLYNMNLAKMDHKWEEFNNENISLENYCDFLLLEAHTTGVDLEPYKVMRLYSLEHKLPVNAAVDYEKLLQEAETLERAIRKKMYTSYEQRQLDHYLYILKVMENLVNISATTDDLRYFRTHREEFKITTMLHFLEDISYRFAIQPDLDPGVLKINQYLDLAAKFYVVADKRSHAFVENIMQTMDRRNQVISVLITGGFHASHVEKALRRQGVSFITVKPRITNTDAANPYFSLLRNEKTPLEKLLARNENIFAPRSLFNNTLFKRYMETVWEVELGRKLVLENGLAGEELQAAYREMRGNYAADDPNVAMVYQAENSNPAKGVYVFTFEKAPEHFVVIRPNTTQNYTLAVPGEALQGNNFMFQFVSQEEFAQKRADILGTEKKGRGGVFAVTGLISKIGGINNPVTRAFGTLAMIVSRPGGLQRGLLAFSNSLSTLSPTAIREGWRGFQNMLAGNRLAAVWLTTISGVLLAGSIIMGIFPLMPIAFSAAFVWSAGTLMQNNQFKSLANSVLLPQGDLIARARTWASDNYGYGANTLKQTDFQIALENVMTLAEGSPTLSDFINNRADRLAMAGMAYRSGVMPWTEGTPVSQVEALAADFMEAESLAEQINQGVALESLQVKGDSPLAQLINAIHLNRNSFELGAQDFINPERILPEYITQAQRDAMLALSKAHDVELAVLDITFNPISNIRPTLAQAKEIKNNVIELSEVLAAKQVSADEFKGIYAKAASGVQEDASVSEDVVLDLEEDIDLGDINLTGKTPGEDTGQVLQDTEASGLELSDRQKRILDRWFTVDGWNTQHVNMDVFTAYDQVLTRAEISELISKTGDNAEVHELGVTLLQKISESLMQATEGLYSAGDILEVFRVVWERGYSVEVATRRFMNERQEYLSRAADAPIVEAVALYEEKNGAIQSVTDLQKMLRSGDAGEQLAIIPAYQYFADRVAAQEQAAMAGDVNYTVDLFLNFNQKIGQRLAGLPAAIQGPAMESLYAEVTQALAGNQGAMSVLVAKKLSGMITSQQAAIAALRNFDQFMQDSMNDAVFQGKEDAIRDGLRTMGQDLLRQAAAQHALGLFSNKAPPTREDLQQLLPEGYPADLLEKLSDAKLTSLFPRMTSQLIRNFSYLYSSSQNNFSQALAALTNAQQTARGKQADIETFVQSQLSEMNSVFDEMTWPEMMQMIAGRYMDQHLRTTAQQSGNALEQMTDLTAELNIVLEVISQLQAKHGGETIAMAALVSKSSQTAKMGKGLELAAYDPWTAAVPLDAYGNQQVQDAINTQLTRIGFTLGEDNTVTLSKDDLLDKLDQTRNKLVAERDKKEKRDVFLKRKKSLSYNESQEHAKLRNQLNFDFMQANSALVQLYASIAEGPALTYRVLVSDKMSDTDHGVALVRGDQICLNANQIQKYAAKNNVTKLMRLLAHETGHIAGLKGDTTGEAFAGIVARLLAGYDMGIEAVSAEFSKAEDRKLTAPESDTAYSGAAAKQDLVAAVKENFNTALTQYRSGRYNQARLMELLTEAERVIEILAKRYSKDEDVRVLQANLVEQKMLLVQGMQLNTFTSRNPGFRQALERIMDQVEESESAITISDFITYAVDGSQVVSRGGVPHATYSNPNAENIRTAGYAGYMRVAVINGQTVLCVDNGSSHFNRPGFRGAEKQFISTLRGIKQALPALGIDKVAFFSGHSVEGMTVFDQSKMVGVIDLTTPTLRASKDIGIQASRQARAKLVMTMGNAVLRSAVASEEALAVQTVGEQIGRGLRVVAVQDQLPHPVDTDFFNWQNRTRDNIDSLQHNGAELVVFPERYMATADPAKMEQAIDALQKQANDKNVNIIMGVRLSAEGMPVDGVLVIRPNVPATIARDLDTLRAVRQGTRSADVAGRPQIQKLLADHPVVAQAFADGLALRDNIVSLQVDGKEYVLHLNICADARQASHYKNLPVNVDLSVNVASTRPEDVELYVANMRKGMGETAPVLVVNAGVSSKRHGGNTMLSLEAGKEFRLQSESQMVGAMAFEVAGLSAQPVLVEEFTQVQSRSEALQEEKTEVYARHIKMRSREVVSVLDSFIEDKTVLASIEKDLHAISAENLSIQTTDKIVGALAVNENFSGKISVVFERQLYGELRASTVLHEIVEAVLQANGIEQSHALAFIIEQALYPESIDAKLSNPRHYDDAHLAAIIENTANVITQIDAQPGGVAAIKEQQKKNTLLVLKAARKILNLRQQAIALNLQERGFYGEETQQTLTQMMTKFLEGRTTIFKKMRLTARQNNIIASQTGDLADAVVKQGFSLMSQKQLNAFFDFFGHNVETRDSEYTRELLRYEIERMEKPLRGTMYEATLARLRNVLTQMEKGNSISVAVLGRDQKIVDLKVRKVFPQKGVPSRAKEIGAFLTIEKTAHGNIGYINVLEGHTVSEAVLHEVLESVLGEPHQTVSELSTFSKYSLGQMTSIRSFFQEIAWPTRLFSALFITVGVVGIISALLTMFFVGTIAGISGAWIAISVLVLVWGVYNYFKIKFVITVDGPDASGKQEIAQVLSRYYGYTLVEAGVYYRAYAWVVKAAIESGRLDASVFENLAEIDEEIDQVRKEIRQKEAFRKDIVYLIDLLDTLKAKKEQLVNYVENQVVRDLEQAAVSMQFDRAATERRMRVFINPERKRRQEITDQVIPQLDAAGKVREVEAGIKLKPIVTALGKVPAIQDMLEIQLRRLAREQNIIAVGQTMGAKIFDRQARAKFYVVNNDLRSRIERKARRRISKDEVVDAMKRLRQLDKLARTRRRDPLQAVTDAVILNTTDFTLAETVSMAHQEVILKSSVLQRLRNRFTGWFFSSNKMLTRAQGEALRKRILEKGGDFWEAFSDIDGLSSYNLIYGKALTNCVLDDVLAVMTETARAPGVKQYLRKGRFEILRKIRQALFQVRFLEAFRLLPKLATGKIFTIRHGGDEGIYVLPDNLSVADTEAVLEVFRKAIQSRMHNQLMAFELPGMDETQMQSLKAIADEINLRYEKFGAKNTVRVVRDEVMGIRVMLKVGFNELSAARKRKLITQLQTELKGYLDQDQRTAYLEGESMEQAGGRLMQGLLQKAMEDLKIDVQLKNMKMADLVSRELRETARAQGVDYLENGAVLTTTATTGATKPSRVPNDMVRKQRKGTLNRTDINQWDDEVYELAGDFLHDGKRGDKHAVYGPGRIVDVEKGMKKNQVVVDQMDKPIEPRIKEEGATLLGETHTEQMQMQKLLFEDNLLLKTEFRPDGNGHKQKYETLYPRHFTIEGLRETVDQRLKFLRGKKNFSSEVYIGRAPPSTGPDKIQVVVITPKETHLIELEGQYYGNFIDTARIGFSESYAEETAQNMKAAGDTRSLDAIIKEIKSDTAGFDAAVDEAMREKFVSMFIDVGGKLVSAKEAALLDTAERAQLTPKYYKFKFLNDFISYSAGDQLIALPHLAIDTIGTDVLRSGKPEDEAIDAFVTAIEAEMNNSGYGNNAQVSLTAVYTSMPTAEVRQPGKIGRMFQDLQVASMAKQGKITPYSRKLLVTARQSMRDLAKEKAASFYRELSAQVRMVRETTGRLAVLPRNEAGFFRLGAAISLLGLGIMTFGIYGIIVTGVFAPIAVGVIASGFLITVLPFIGIKIIQSRQLQVQPQEVSRFGTLRKLARRAVDFVRGNPMIILMIAGGLYSYFNQEAGGGMLAMGMVGSLGSDEGYPGKINFRTAEFTDSDGDTFRFKIPLSRDFKRNEKIEVIKNGNTEAPLKMGCQDIYAGYILSILQASFPQIPQPEKNHIQIFRNGPINGVKRYLNVVVAQVFDGQEEMRSSLQDIVSDAWEESFGDSFGMRRYLAKKTAEKQITVDGKLVRVIFTDIQKSEQLRISEVIQQDHILDAALEELFGMGFPEKLRPEDYISVSYIDKGAEKAAYLINIKSGRGFRSLVLKTTNKPGNTEVVRQAVKAFEILRKKRRYKALLMGPVGKDWMFEEYFPGERISGWEPEFENPDEEFLQNFEDAVIAVVGEYMKLARIGGTIFDPTFKNILVKRVQVGKKFRWTAAMVDMTTLDFPEDFPPERHLYRLYENFKKGWSVRKEWVPYSVIYRGVMKIFGPVRGAAYLQSALDNLIATAKDRELYPREEAQVDTLVAFLNDLEKANLSGTLQGAKGELLLGTLLKNATESMYNITLQPAKALATIAAFSRDRIEEIVNAVFSAQGLAAVTLSRYRGRASPIRNQLADYLEMAVNAARDETEAAQIKKINATQISIHIARRVDGKRIETDQDLYETGAFHLNGKVYITGKAFQQFENNRKDNEVVAAIVLHEALESVGFSHDRADEIVTAVTGYSTDALIARVEGMGVVSGILTSDESQPGRLKDTDDYMFDTLLPEIGIDLSQNNPVTGKAPVFIEVGPGRDADTTLETAKRIGEINREAQVIGIENSLENYRQIVALEEAHNNVAFQLGGFEIQQENVDIIRCTNVLRWYKSEQAKQAAVQSMGKALREGGILIEGRVSTIGDNSSILVHIKRNGRLVPYQMMMRFSDNAHEFPDSLDQSDLLRKIRTHLGQARSKVLQDLRQSFGMLSPQILRLLPGKLNSAMEREFGYSVDSNDSNKLLINFDAQGKPQAKPLRYQWLSLKNTLVVSLLWTMLLLPVVGMGPGLAIGLLYPSAKLAAVGRALYAKHGWSGMLKNWGKPVGAYDPVTQKMVDPVTGQVVAEAPWPIVAHESYSHVLVDKMMRQLGLDITRQQPGTPAYRVMSGLAEFMAHTLDFFTAPVAIARVERSGVRTGALVLSGVFTLSGVMLAAGLFLTIPAALAVLLPAAMAVSGIGIGLMSGVQTPRDSRRSFGTPGRNISGLLNELLQKTDYARAAQATAPYDNIEEALFNASLDISDEAFAQAKKQIAQFSQSPRREILEALAKTVGGEKNTRQLSEMIRILNHYALFYALQAAIGRLPENRRSRFMTRGVITAPVFYAGSMSRLGEPVTESDMDMFWISKNDADHKAVENLKNVVDGILSKELGYLSDPTNEIYAIETLENWSQDTDYLVRSKLLGARAMTGSQAVQADIIRIQAGIMADIKYQLDLTYLAKQQIKKSISAITPKKTQKLFYNLMLMANSLYGRHFASVDEVINQYVREGIISEAEAAAMLRAYSFMIDARMQGIPQQTLLDDVAFNQYSDQVKEITAKVSSALLPQLQAGMAQKLMQFRENAEQAVPDALLLSRVGNRESVVALWDAMNKNVSVKAALSDAQAQVLIQAVNNISIEDLDSVIRWISESQARAQRSAMAFAQVDDTGTIQNVIDQILRVQQIGAATPQTAVRPAGGILLNMREGRLGQWFNRMRGVPTSLRLMLLLSNPRLQGFAKTAMLGLLLSVWAGLGVALMGGFSVELAVAGTMLGVATFAPAQYYHYRLKTSITSQVSTQLVQSRWMQQSLQNLGQKWDQAKVMFLVQGLMSVLEGVQDSTEASKGVLSVLGEIPPGIAKETITVTTRDGTKIDQVVPRIVIEKPYLLRKLLKMFPATLWKGEPLQLPKPLYRRGLDSAA
ncbi:(d)CMP kinase [bacterium]|nr:(d)CMP kinase [bacterium]